MLFYLHESAWFTRLIPKGKSVAQQHSCCLKLVGIQCRFQGHFIWVESCHHEGILQSQHGSPIKQSARTDTGSSNGPLNASLLLSSLLYPVTRHHHQLTTDHSCSDSVFIFDWEFRLWQRFTWMWRPWICQNAASFQQLQPSQWEAASIVFMSVGATLRTVPDQWWWLRRPAVDKFKGIFFCGEFVDCWCSVFFYSDNNGCYNSCDGCGCKDCMMTHWPLFWDEEHYCLQQRAWLANRPKLHLMAGVLTVKQTQEHEEQECNTNEQLGTTDRLIYAIFF